MTWQFKLIYSLFDLENKYVVFIFVILFFSEEKTVLNNFYSALDFLFQPIYPDGYPYLRLPWFQSSIKMFIFLCFHKQKAKNNQKVWNNLCSVEMGFRLSPNSFKSSKNNLLADHKSQVWSKSQLYILTAVKTVHNIYGLEMKIGKKNWFGFSKRNLPFLFVFNGMVLPLHHWNTPWVAYHKCKKKN